MAAQVHRDHGVPLLVGHVEQHPVAGDAGIVHHDVQSAQPDGAGEQFVGRRALADITGYRDGLSTSIGSGGADLVDDVGSIQGGSNIVDDDGGAQPGQAERFGPTQTRGRAGDHRHLSGQIGRVRGTRRAIGLSQFQFMNTSSSVLLTTRQRRTRAFRDGLLGQILLINRDRIGLDHGIVLVVQVEDIRCDSQAHRVAFTSVSVHDHPHGTLLTLTIPRSLLVPP